MDLSFNSTGDIRPFENQTGIRIKISRKYCNFLKLTSDIGDPPVKGPKTHTGGGHKGLILG